MNETDKLIEEQRKTLSSSLLKAIDTVPWKSSVKEIALLNKLNFEQVATIERETMFIIYGFESPNDYTSNMVREAGISEDVAYTIAESVANKIFDPILKKSEEHEVKQDIHPMIESGEVAHDVAQATSVAPARQDLAPARQDLAGSSEQPKVSLPDYRYESGKDPYRESLK